MAYNSLLMSFLNKISPNGMCLHRMFYPQGNYHIDFELDEESQYFFGNVCSSPTDEVKLKEGIERAAYHLVFTMPYTEFEKVQISEVVGMVIDPTNNDRLFSLSLRKGKENNHLLVTKARVIVKEVPKESLIADKLNATPLKVKTTEDSYPIIITFSISEKSRNHLDDIESMCENKSEADTIRKNIQRAIGEWVYENIDKLGEGNTYERKIEGALDNENEYKFSFTVISFNKIIVDEIKVYERDPYKFQ